MPSLSSHLSHAFKIIDASVSAAIKSSQVQPACGNGCYVCCLQPIPLTPLELLAIMEHVRLEWTPEKRKMLLPSVQKTEDLPPQNRGCPFLFQNSCSIYSLRPMACRRFLVGREKCALGENPAESRPQDMIVPNRTELHAALLSTFPWHAENASKYRLPASPPLNAPQNFKLAWLRQITTIIQAADWQKILSV